MRFLNIASGSSGNATYVGTDDAHILIDAGISRKRITEGLWDAEVTLSDLDAILITHEHIDHISSLGVLLRTREIPVYATKGTIEGILNCPMLGNYPADLLVPIEVDQSFSIKDLTLKPLRISHDANDPVCYRFEQGKRSGAIVTDLGVCNDYLKENLEDLDFLMLELPKYKTAYNAILKATDIRTASDVFMTKYEKPGNVSDAAKEKRAQKAWAYYLKYYRSDDTKIKMVKFTAHGVRLRRGNGLNYPIVAQKNEGDILKWVATAENNWHAVEYDRQVVWCSGEYSEVV